MLSKCGPGEECRVSEVAPKPAVWDPCARACCYFGTKLIWLSCSISFCTVESLEQEKQKIQRKSFSIWPISPRLLNLRRIRSVVRQSTSAALYSRTDVGWPLILYCIFYVNCFLLSPPLFMFVHFHDGSSLMLCLTEFCNNHRTFLSQASTCRPLLPHQWLSVKQSSSSCACVLACVCSLIIIFSNSEALFLAMSGSSINPNFSWINIDH